MIRIPISWLEWAARHKLWSRPHFLCREVAEAPFDEMARGLIYDEVRGGHRKWAHLVCPRCGEHIQLQTAMGSDWIITRDWLHRPTVHPSIWETEGCGAHFFIHRGQLIWCEGSSSEQQHFLAPRSPRL
jgi:Family of unknown function (DUF6527)